MKRWDVRGPSVALAVVALAVAGGSMGISRAWLTVCGAGLAVLYGLATVVLRRRRRRRAADAGDAEAMRERGARLMAARRDEEAEVWLRRAVEAGDAGAVVLLSDLLHSSGRTDEEERLLRDALGDANEPGGETDGDRAAVMVVLGGLLVASDRAAEAERWYRRAIEAGEPDGLAMYALGDLLVAAGREDEGESWYRRAADAGQPHAMTALGDLLGRAGRTEEAREWYGRVAMAGNTIAMRRLAESLSATGRFDEAEYWYRRAARAGDAEAMRDLGDLLAGTGRSGAAAKWYGRAADGPRPPGFARLFGRAFFTTPSARSTSFVLRYVLPVISIATLSLAVPALGPSLRAEFGHGTAGTFTAERLDCQDECRWHGEFVSTDGRVRREDVFLYGAGRHDLHAGEQVPAKDTASDGEVYPPGASHEWASVVVFLLIEFVVAAMSVMEWRSWVVVRRARRAEDALSTPSAESTGWRRRRRPPRKSHSDSAGF